MQEFQVQLTLLEILLHFSDFIYILDLYNLSQNSNSLFYLLNGYAIISVQFYIFIDPIYIPIKIYIHKPGL